jgi:hypothetical protein
LHFFDQGGLFYPALPGVSRHNFTKEEISAIASGAKYWADILSPKAPVQPVLVNIGKADSTLYNAWAYPLFINENENISRVQDVLANGNLSNANF